MILLAIDPANIESAYVLIDMDTYKPIKFGKIPNKQLIKKLVYSYEDEREKEYMSFYVDEELGEVRIDKFAIEMVACYGMAVGATIFDTCVWIGRFVERAIEMGMNADDITFIFRKEEKLNLCNSTRAKDSNIRQALIDRFGEEGTNGIGTKKNPLYFYGFKADIWAAYAVGVTYIDKYINKLM